MACAVEQLVMGNDVIGMAKRFLQGMEISEEKLTFEVISKVGPGGHFLSRKHTLKNFREELWQTSVFTRQAIRNWEEKGSKDGEDRVREKMVSTLETHEVPPLSHGILSERKRRIQ